MATEREDHDSFNLPTSILSLFSVEGMTDDSLQASPVGNIKYAVQREQRWNTVRSLQKLLEMLTDIPSSKNNKITQADNPGDFVDLRGAVLDVIIEMNPDVQRNHSGISFSTTSRSCMTLS